MEDGNRRTKNVSAGHRLRFVFRGCGEKSRDCAIIDVGFDGVQVEKFVFLMSVFFKCYDRWCGCCVCNSSMRNVSVNDWEKFFEELYF